MTLEEQLALQAKKGLMGLGLEQETAEEYAPWASLVAQFIPGVGEGVGIDNTVNAINDERYGDAAVEGGLTLLGAVPVLGDMAAAAIKGIRRAPTSLLDDAADAVKKAEVDDPRPFPGVRRKDMSPEDEKTFLAWQRRERRRNMTPEQADRERASSRKSHQKYLDERKTKQADYREANRGQINQRMRDRYAEDPDVRVKAKAHAAQKHAAQIERSPEWRSSERIDEIYKSADEATQITGVPHEVDHVIPLQGEHVSGLHHQDNLMVVPRRDNRAKYNIFEPGDLPPRAGVRKSRAYLKKIKEAKEKAKR